MLAEFCRSEYLRPKAQWKLRQYHGRFITDLCSVGHDATFICDFGTNPNLNIFKRSIFLPQPRAIQNAWMEANVWLLTRASVLRTTEETTVNTVSVESMHSAGLVNIATNADLGPLTGWVKDLQLTWRSFTMLLRQSWDIDVANDYFLSTLPAISNCDPKKLGFNGGYNCTGEGMDFGCKLWCPAGVNFKFPAAAFYECDYATGRWSPQPIPDCDYGEWW